MISIIIINYNVKVYLQKCIQSILKYIDLNNYEIIIVDNNSSDESVRMIKENFNNIKIIQNNKNLGFSKAVNIGINNSKGDFIALVNPDTIFEENSILTLKNFLINKNNIGVVGCKILNPNRTFQLSSRRGFPYILNLFYKFIGLNRIFPKSTIFSKYNQTYISEDKIQDIESVSGALMVFKKDIINHIGNFDEQFFLYFEDTDFCLRAIEAGFRVVYCPLTYIIHYKSASSRLDIINKYNHFDISFLKFYKKYKDRYSYNFMTYIMLKIFINIRIIFRKQIKILF